MTSGVKVVGARLRKVSRYGMTIESPVALDHGSVMRFRLEVRGEKADVEACVVSCAPSGERKGFDVGLEFTRLPRTIQEALTRATAPADASASSGSRS